MDNDTSSLDTPTKTTTLSSLSQTELKVLLAAIMCLPEFKPNLTRLAALTHHTNPQSSNKAFTRAKKSLDAVTAFTFEDGNLEGQGQGENAAPKAKQRKRMLKPKGPSEDNKVPRTGAKRVKRGDGGDVDGGEDDDGVQAVRGGGEGAEEVEGEMAPPKTKGRKPALKPKAAFADNKVQKPRAKRVKGGRDSRQDEEDEEQAAQMEVKMEDGGKKEGNGDVPAIAKAEDSSRDLAPADEGGSSDDAGAGGDVETADGSVVAAEMSGGDDGE
ncbi:MAG: hypothetical protein Q9187_002701 [Circinaria calcarea]